jgi:hypothetical protein
MKWSMLDLQIENFKKLGIQIFSVVRSSVFRCSQCTKSFERLLSPINENRAIDSYKRVDNIRIKWVQC